MGSYCGINFDDLSICDSKSAVPDDWAALFQERDRRERNHADEEDEQKVVEYIASRDVLLQRLAILGATEEGIRRVFDEWLCQERATWQNYSAGWAKDVAIGERAVQILKGLNELDYVILKGVAAVESAETARVSFPDLELIWQHIFDLVERNTGADYLRIIERLKQEA